MALTPYTAFLPDVMPYAGTTPEPMVLAAIRHAAIELCTRSLIWNEGQAPVSVTAAQLPITLTAPEEARVCAVLSVKVDGRGIDPKSPTQLDNQYPQWEDATGAAECYYLTAPNALQLVPVPEVAVKVRFRLAYAPSRAGTGVPAFLYETQLETIAAGALARLTGDAGKQLVFEAGVRQAMVVARKAFSISGLRVDLSNAQ